MCNRPPFSACNLSQPANVSEFTLLTLPTPMPGALVFVASIWVRQRQEAAGRVRL